MVSILRFAKVVVVNVGKVSLNCDHYQQQLTSITGFYCLLLFKLYTHVTEWQHSMCPYSIGGHSLGISVAATI